MTVLRTLAIDTSGKVASAAITEDGVLLAEKSVYTKLTHSQIILPMVKELMNGAELKFSDIDSVVCAKGPGSYTGLRIGIAAVKGIVMGAPHLKCAAISTLEALAWNCAAYRGTILSVMRARKGILYCGVYESDGEKIKNIVPDTVCAEDKLCELIGGDAIITGDCCSEIKQNYFAKNDNVKCAPPADRLQKASSLCMAYESDISRAISADELNAAYLQETKAEKDKAHR